jgi:hypothetical protein
MNLIYNISKSVLLFTTIIVISCNKDNANDEITLSYQYLADKTWYLDYDQTDSLIKTYIGQSTYYINFIKNRKTIDSDGLSGTYSVEKINNQLQIHVQAITKQLNPIEYIYNIESIGSKHLVLSYTTGGNKTTLFYSIK